MNMTATTPAMTFSEFGFNPSDQQLTVALTNGTVDSMWMHAPLYARIDNGNLNIYYHSTNHPPVKIYLHGEWEAFSVRQSA